MKSGSYKRALKDARAELKVLFQQREELERKIARTRQSVIALGKMCDEDKRRDFLKATVNNEHAFGLTGAIRMALMAADAPLSPLDVRRELENVGYDIGPSPNVLRSIHTIVKRLIASGEVKSVGRKIRTGKDKGLWGDALMYWWGEHGLPKGWSIYPDKRLGKEWDKSGKAAEEWARKERAIEEAARKGEL